jgi:RNA polymerase sigma factor (sigma-70 family)
MSAPPADLILTTLRRTVPAEARASDRHLLDRFAAGRDQSAFAELLRRHGPMVLGVCRRALGHRHDAEDAFQATFLMLARRAGAVRGESPAAWLHRVAVRTARRAAARRRWVVDRPEAEDRAGDPLESASWREVRRALDEELERLPAGCRAALVLCYLDGLARDEAARRLGWSIGTLKRRLDQGRRGLRARLGRRGILPAGLAAAALVPGGLTAAVPTELAGAALRLAAGGAAPPAIAALLPGTGRAARVIAVLVLLAGIAGLGAGVNGRRAEAEPPAAEAAQPPAAAPARPGMDAQGDPLPEGALLRVGTVRFRHGKSIEAGALSPDGKVLVTAGVDAVRAFDAATGRLLWEVDGLPLPHGYGPGRWFVAVSPDGSTLTVACDDGAVQSWDLATGKPRPTPVPALAPRPGPRVRPDDAARGMPGRGFCSVAYSPDGKRLATGGPVRVWDLTTGQALLTVPTHGGLVHFAPDGQSLAVSGADDGEVVLVSAADGKERHRLPHPKVLRAAFSPDGALLATIGEDGALRLWETATGRPRAEWARPFAGEGHHPAAVAFDPAGRTLAAGGTDGVIRLWDVAAGRERRALTGHRNYVTGLFFAPDGRTLYSVSWDRTARRWDVATGEERPVTPDRIGHVDAALSPDGRLLATGGGAGTVCLTELPTGRRRQVLRGPSGYVFETAFFPDGATLAAGGDGSVVRLWDVASGRERGAPLGRPGRYGVRGVAVSPDGKLLASATDEDHRVRLWDPATGQELRVLEHPSATRVAFAPDGRVLASGGWDHAVRLWDPATGRLVRTVPTDGIVDGLTFSPDGRWFATGHHNGQIRLWEVFTGREVRGWAAGQGVVWSLAFTPGGLELFSAGEDGSLKLWDTATGQELMRRGGHRGWALSVAAGPDGRTAVTAGMDDVALAWDARPAGQPWPAAGSAGLWDDLAAGGPAAWRAGWALVDHPAEAVALVRERVRPAAPPDGPDPAAVRKLLADLDSTKFAERDRATRELRRLGRRAEPFLRQALANPPSAEARQRAQALLDELPPEVDSPEALRERRAVRALALVGTPDARRLLEALAGGAPEARLTRDAAAALKRLGG